MTETEGNTNNSADEGHRVSYDGLEPADDLPEGEFDHDQGYFETSAELVPPAYYRDLEVDEQTRERDDARLYWQQWRPADRTEQGIVALMHGYGEHSSRYGHVAGALCRAGYSTIALDARGHGQSSGHRGHVDSFDEYVLDFAEFIERIRRRFGRKPLNILGHSNGGLIVLRYAIAARDQSHVNAWAVTSPFCGFAADVPAIKAAAGKALSRIWGTLSLATDIDPGNLSHLESVAENYADDPLVFEEATARWFTETLAAQKEVAERASDISQPFLFLLAGDDRIVDAEKARDIFHDLSSSDRELEIYSDLYHEILNETSWSKVVDCLISWFDRHSEPDGDREREGAT